MQVDKLVDGKHAPNLAAYKTEVETQPSCAHAWMRETLDPVKTAVAATTGSLVWSEHYLLRVGLAWVSKLASPTEGAKFGAICLSLQQTSLSISKPELHNDACCHLKRYTIFLLRCASASAY